MTVEMQARHFELTPQIREYVERKVGRLDRYLPDIHATRVELSRDMTRSQGEVYSAQITAWVHNAVLRAEETNPDVFSAIDESTAKIFRQIEKYKGRRMERWHGRAETAPVSELELEDEESDGGAVVRRKQFRVFAMTEAEALEQLELLGHDFFVYKDGDSGGIHVAYRRRDGGYGVIEPVPA
jgi:putative sigma-54 modulation protein